MRRNGDQFPDAEFLQVMLDNRVGVQDELAEEGVFAPVGLSNHRHRGKSPPGAGVLSGQGTSSSELD